MNIKHLISLGAMAAFLTACGGNDGITLSPTTVDNSTDNSTGGGGTGSNNPCASYEIAGEVSKGSYDGTNCIYSASFVSNTRPLEVDLNIPSLPNGGVHIFRDSLFVGLDVNSTAAAAGESIPQDGEGPTLSIDAGVKLGFTASDDYIRIARGSRIVAEGTASNPIIFSSDEDLIDDSLTEGDRGAWGGVQINGNGLTNKCTDTDRQATANNPHNCHVTAEGRPATYGGNNNAESSGTLRYVQIRYAGFEVVDGSELNGLTLNGVGSGTTIEYVQTYTTQDDGFEMFGGAVDLKNIVAVNVGDDSIDYSEGYVGNIQYALVVHTSGSNRCIEGDNTGGSRLDDIPPYTKLRISNMTCITSNVDEDEGSFPTSKGSSEGPLFREGVYFEMYNSIITSNDPVMTSNECVEITSSQAIAGVDPNGYSVASGNLVACAGDAGDDNNPALKTDAGFDIETWWTANNALVNDSADLPAQVIDGLDSNPRAYITASSFADANAGAINVSVYDVTQLEDSFDAQAAPAVGTSGSSSFFEAVNFIGAVSANDDWVAGWTVGLE